MKRRIRGTLGELDEQAQRLRKHPTAAEAKLWGRLRAHRLDGYKFRRQHALGQMILDFVCISERLVIEVDGEIHAGMRERDEQRDQALRAYGYRVMRVSNERVMNDMDGVLDDLRALLRQGA